MVEFFSGNFEEVEGQEDNDIAAQEADAADALVPIKEGLADSKKESGLVYEHAWQGWETNYSLSKKSGVAESTVSKISRKYKDTNRSEFKKFLNAKNLPGEFMSPIIAAFVLEEIAKIKKKREGFDKAPAGWATVNSLAERIGVRPKKIIEIADEFRNSNPKWFGVYIATTRNVPLEHYSPELVAAIEKKLEYAIKRKEEKGRMEFPPRDWISLSDVARELNFNRGTANKIVSRLEALYGGEMGVYLNRRKNIKPTTYLSPKLADIVRKELIAFQDERKNYEPAPAGWRTLTSLIINTSFDSKKMREFVNPYRLTNPEWFRDFIDNERNSIYEYYAPELTAIISQYIESYNERKQDIEKADPGWETISNLANDLHTCRRCLKAQVDVITARHPEFKRDFLSPVNAVREYYHPDLIKMLQEKSEYTEKFRVSKREVQEMARLKKEFCERQQKALMDEVERKSRRERRGKQIVLAPEQRMGKLDGILNTIFMEQWAKLPVNTEGRIDMERFKDDKSFGAVRVDDDLRKVNYAQLRHKKNIYAKGMMMEKLMPILFYKFFGKQFIFTRTSEFDDQIGERVDAAVFSKDGDLLCLFDEIVEDNLIGSNIGDQITSVQKLNMRGGARLKYGFMKRDSRVILGQQRNVPVFYINLFTLAMDRCIDGLDLNGGISNFENLVINRIIHLIYKQIDEIKVLLSSGEIDFGPGAGGRDLFEKRLGKLELLMDEAVPEES